MNRQVLKRSIAAAVAVECLAAFVLFYRPFGIFATVNGETAFTYLHVPSSLLLDPLTRFFFFAFGLTEALSVGLALFAAMITIMVCQTVLLALLIYRVSLVDRKPRGAGIERT
jgi:hypothetical protein